MIRVNLLPRSLRRRRLRLPRELVTAAVMVLGWAVAMSVGFFWIAAHSARAGEFRADKVLVEAEIKRLNKQIQNPELAARQEVLRVRRRALHQLHGERRSPLAALVELGELIGQPGGAAREAGDDAPLRLVEVHGSSSSTWRLDGTARDAVALGELVRRVQASERFSLSYGPEYARAGDGRLHFRVDLAVASWD